MKLGEALKNLLPAIGDAPEPAPPTDPYEIAAMHCPVCGGVGWVHGVNGLAAPCECLRRVWEAERTERMVAWCELDATSRQRTFANWVRVPAMARSHDTAWAYARTTPAKPFLVLWGPPGTGKTHLLLAILNHRLDSGGVAGKYIHATAWLRALKATFDREREAVAAGEPALTYEEVFRAYEEAPLLGLDDLGAHKHSDWADEQFDLLIDTRWRKALPTIVTTNLALDNLAGSAAARARIASRLQDRRLATVIQVRAPDYRLGR